MEALEEFAGIGDTEMDTTYLYREHKELKESRMQRDKEDLNSFLQWLRIHDPFSEKFNKDNMLCSVFSGLKADMSINCDRAKAVGTELLSRMKDNTFGELKLHRNDRVSNLASLTSTVKVKGEPVVINQQQLLNRILAVIESGSDLKDYCRFEFVNYGPSLFDDFSMRKTQKSAILQSLPISWQYSASPYADIWVFDGGWLTHTVVWNTPCPYLDVVLAYPKYLNNNFRGQKGVVLDGYAPGQQKSTKCVEQERRATGKTSIDIEVSLQALTTTQQDEFLSNGHNKNQLNQYLAPCLRANGISVTQAKGDADVPIVMKGIQLAQENPTLKVAIVGTDTDLIA